jgi:thiamine transport system ATP-binding protein
MLEIKDVKFAYHDSDEFHFNAKVDKGQIIAILGKSGSGKSTFFDLLAGFLEPQSGEILLDGKKLISLPVDKRPLTILFQHHNLFEHLSVEKNIQLGNKKASSQEISDILQEVGLAGFEKKKATTLSGGQQQRVALARALIRNKPILLLDEPFTGLDSDTKEQMLALVENITKKHALHTIMITHDKDDTKIASHIYTMEHGRLS